MGVTPAGRCVFWRGPVAVDMNLAAVCEGCTAGAGAGAAAGFWNGFMGAVAVDLKSPAGAVVPSCAGVWVSGLSLIVFFAVSAVLGVCMELICIRCMDAVLVLRMSRGSLTPVPV